MPSVQATCTGATPVLVAFDAPVTRAVCTIVGAPAEVYVTGDGTVPVVPADGAVNSSNQQVIAGVLGESVTVWLPRATAPPANAVGPAGMPLTALRLASVGDAVVQVEW